MTPGERIEEATDEASQTTASDHLLFRLIARDVAQLLKTEWRIALGLAIVVFAPLALLEALLGPPELVVRTDRDLDAAALASTSASVITQTLGSHFYAGVLAGAMLHRRALARRFSITQTLRTVPYLRLLALDLVITMAVGLGILALVVPGLLAIVYLWLAPAAVEIEHLKLRPALLRSIELVRGSFWRVAWIFLAFQVVQSLLGGVAQFGGASVAGEHVGSFLATLIVAPVAATAVISITLELRALEAARRAD